LKDYVAQSNDAASATEQAFANAFRGAADALVGFIGTGKLEFQGLADSILTDLTRITVRQTITAPIAGERPPAVRYADSAVFERAPRYHGGGFAGAGLLPDEVPIIARRGELVVPPERVVREEKRAREQRPITVVVNVTTADASSFRASQGQIVADMARAIDRARRNR
jgi:phage-related minor tail protein